MRPGAVLLLGLLPCALAAAAQPNDFPVPGWLFPVATTAPAPPTPAAPDPTPLRVPGSMITYTRAELTDLYAAPDWFPGTHRLVPGVVAHGRRPDLPACGYCHLPDGSGRPENATLAGLSAGYIVDQMAAFASGSRHGAWPGPGYRPSLLMAQAATQATEAEIAEAAAYFSSLRLQRPRAQVVETERVPRTRVGPWIHVTVDDAGDEPLGLRLIEVPASLERHELRDPNTPYVAYVPVGSLSRGRALARDGERATPACESCHGAGLRGDGPGPPLAGRSPTYLLRQLVALRTRARNAPAAAAMQPVVDALALEDMIAAAAYAASLEP